MPKDEPKYEYKKHDALRPQYIEGLREIISLGFEPSDFIHHFPAFCGHLTLARFLSLYEAYKLTVNKAGHIAEVGVSLGAGSLFFAKLMQLFEPNSINLVHGFDWFKGAKTTSEEKFVKDGECSVDEETVKNLIRAQGLDNIVHIHNIDITTQLEDFFKDNKHILFKLVFLDCGIYDVVAKSIEFFWPRLVTGGVLILDHFSHEFAPGETRAVMEMLPETEFKQFSFGWMPVAYTIK